MVSNDLIAFPIESLKSSDVNSGKGLGQITIIRKFFCARYRRDRGAEKRATLGHEDHVSLEKLNRHKESFRCDRKLRAAIVIARQDVLYNRLHVISGRKVLVPWV